LFSKIYRHLGDPGATINNIGRTTQSDGITQIGKAMSELDMTTQHNASASEEVAASASELSSQADMLQNLVSDLNRVIYGESNESTNEKRPLM